MEIDFLSNLMHCVIMRIFILLIFAFISAQNALLAQVSNLAPKGYEEFNIRVSNFKGDFYRVGNIYGGRVSAARFHMEGEVHRTNMKESLVINHLQGIEVYNFTTRNWVKMKLIPTDAMMITHNSVSVGHLAGLGIEKKKIDLYLGLGPTYNINEFNTGNGAGFMFRVRLRLK